jgi:hypothetical protein
MDALTTFLPILLTICLTILTITLVVVGVQVFVVLRSLQKTIDRVNTTIDVAESKVNSVLAPFQTLGGMSASLGVGLKVFESFVGWLNRSKKD